MRLRTVLVAVRFRKGNSARDKLIRNPCPGLILFSQPEPVIGFAWASNGSFSVKSKLKVRSRLPQNWADVASLIWTCKLNAVEPLAHLTAMLTVVNGYKQSQIQRLLPWNTTQVNLCKGFCGPGGYSH